jgi:hypothetical protein
VIWNVDADMLEEPKKQTPGPNKSSYVPPRQAPRRKPVSSSHVGVVRRPGKLFGHAPSCRYEIKYLISESKAWAIAQFVEAYLPLDRYCKSQPSGAYPVATLYLDSHHLHLCRESLEGRKNRFKLRIRSYTDDTDYPCFFEIKRRMNSIIIKDRARVRHPNVASLRSGLSLPPEDCGTEHQTLKQFQLYVNSINAAPVIKVRYMRRAYEGTSSNRARVTFDRQLAFKTGNIADVSLYGQGWQQHPTNEVILEIKFTGLYPAWLSRMIKCFDLRPQSLSKYVRSVKRSCLLKFCAPEIPARMY